MLLSPSVNSFVRSFLHYRRWHEWVTWAILSDLFVHPKRALNRYRMVKAQRQMYRSYSQMDYIRAENLSNEAIELASKVGNHPVKWHAIYFCHQYMALILCKRGEWKEASKHLVLSSENQGMQLLRLIVPPFQVPSLLLQHGEKQSVLDYLNNIEKWWACGVPIDDQLCRERREAISKWKNEIKKGNIPEEYPWPSLNEKASTST